VSGENEDIFRFNRVQPTLKKPALFGQVNDTDLPRHDFLGKK